MNKEAVPIGMRWGTRLIHVERFPTHWRCWTALAQGQIAAPTAQRRGSFIDLFDDGSAASTTVHPDGTETITTIKKERPKDV